MTCNGKGEKPRTLLPLRFEVGSPSELVVIPLEAAEVVGLQQILNQLAPPFFASG